MDFSYPHKIWVRLNSYAVDIFNYYHPLDSFIQLASTYNFTVQRILETTIPKKYQNWPEEKYRLPNAYVFKLLGFKHLTQRIGYPYASNYLPQTL